MILVNFFDGRGVYYNLRELTAHRVTMAPVTSTRAANDRACANVTVLRAGTPPEREP